MISSQAQAGSIRTLEGPPRARIGPGAIAEAGLIAKELGMHRALIVMDPALATSPGAETLQVKLAENSVRPYLSTKVTPTPLYADVDAAVAEGHAHDCDGVISFGGGSTHDVAKAAALLLAAGGDIDAYAHHGKVAERTLPHLAVNTTAGTGAESSSYAFLREDHGREHTILHHPILMPEAVILDSRIQATMPPHLTAATGLNALTDAIEAYVSPAATPRSDARALAAVHAIGQALPTAVAHPHDLAARDTMAEASFRAGQAFNEAGLGVIDSISLVLTNLFSMGHSDANAMVLPYAMASEAYAGDDRLADVGQALGGEASRSGALHAVRNLQEDVGVSGTLADRGLSRDDIYLCAGSILNHPFMTRGRTLDEAALTDILLEAIEGAP